MRLAASAVAIGIAASFGAGAQPANDWPQLFGPARNATTAAAIGADASLSVAWKKPMPVGTAGVVVAGGHAYTVGSDGDQDVLFALDAATGNEEWRVELGKTHPDATANGPAGTPAVAGDILLAVSTACQLQAISTKTRRAVWTQDLEATYASRFAKRGGCGMSPLIAGSRAILVTGSTNGSPLVAFDVASGKPEWTAAQLPNSPNLAPGWMTTSAGGLVLYHHSKPPGVSGVTAVNAETGTTAWQIDGAEGGSNVTTVPAGDGRVIVETWSHVSAYDIASRKELWKTREIAALGSPAVYANGSIFTFGGQSGEFFTCVDAATGKTRWTARIYRGSLVLAGHTLVVLSESSGLLRLVAADPAGYRELAKVEVLDPGARTTTPPSVAGGRIFVRNLEEIVAVNAR